jgi:hypothetical protein
LYPASQTKPLLKIFSYDWRKIVLVYDSPAYSYTGLILKSSFKYIANCVDALFGLGSCGIIRLANLSRTIGDIAYRTPDNTGIFIGVKIDNG